MDGQKSKVSCLGGVNKYICAGLAPALSKIIWSIDIYLFGVISFLGLYPCLKVDLKGGQVKS